MTTPFGGSGMCLWARGLRYVTFLQRKNAQCEKSNIALISQTYEGYLQDLVIINVCQSTDRGRENTADTISLT